jgi:general secretion pathway protein J
VKPSERGFTLLEMLLAVVLLATLMVLLADAMSLVSHRLSRSTERVDRAGMEALVQNYLRAALSQAIPAAVASDSGSSLDFDGDGENLTFVARAPSSAPLGGLIKLDLRFAPGSHGTPGALVIDWRPYRDLGSDVGTGGASPGTRQLLAGASTAGFAYYDPGAPDRPPGWVEEWHDQPVLPSLVRISVEFADGATMPDLVVALRLAGPVTPAPKQATPGSTPPATQ